MTVIKLVAAWTATLVVLGLIAAFGSSREVTVPELWFMLIGLVQVIFFTTLPALAITLPLHNAGAIESERRLLAVFIGTASLCLVALLVADKLGLHVIFVDTP